MWMISLILRNIMFLRSIQADFYTSSSSLLGLKSLPLHNTSYLTSPPPPADGHSQQGHFFVITNSASVNARGHTPGAHV